jgi:protein TonB
VKVAPIIGSVALHLVLLGLMSRLELERLPPSKIIEIAVTKVAPPPPPPPPPPPEPEPPPPPKPPSTVVPKKVKQITQPKPENNEPPPAPQPTPPPPPPQGFSVDMSNVAATGAVAVPAIEGGGNMFAKPDQQLPPGQKTTTAPPPPVGRGTGGPASELQVTEMPKFDGNEEDRTPPYPREAKALEVEGTVVLRIYVAETGRVTDVKVLKRLGSGCDEIAVKWAKEKWRFSPAKQGTRPVGVWITVPVRFELDR